MRKKIRRNEIPVIQPRTSSLFGICPDNYPNHSFLQAPRYYGQLIVDLNVPKIQTLKVIFFM